MIAPCPDCGAAVDTRGLPPHQRGGSCTVRANVREALGRGLLTAHPHQVLLGQLGAVESVRSRFVPGGIGKRAKIEAQPWAPAALVALAAEMRAGGADMATRRSLLRGAIERRALLPSDERRRRDLLAQSASGRAPVAEWQRAAGVVYAVEPITTPADTLRAAGASTTRGRPSTSGR